MKLSKHFSLREMLKSDTGQRHGIENVYNDRVLCNLTAICQRVLEPLREEFGPIQITSGYRHPDINRLIGSSDSSSHIAGFLDGGTKAAVDCEAFSSEISNLQLVHFIRDNLSFSQVISEYWIPGDPHSGWVHVSYDSIDASNNCDCLTASRVDGKTQYSEGLPEA